MIQEILTYSIVAAVVGVSVWRVVGRFRRKKTTCDTHRSGGCAGCPLSDSCGKATK